MEYFCSQISRKLLDNLTSEYIWMRTLQNQSEASLVEPLCTSCTKGFFNVMSMPPAGTSTSNISALPPSTSVSRRNISGGSHGIPRSTNTTTSSDLEKTIQQPFNDSKSRTDELNNAISHLKDITLEQLAESTLLETKKSIFS